MATTEDKVKTPSETVDRAVGITANILQGIVIATVGGIIGYKLHARRVRRQMKSQVRAVPVMTAVQSPSMN